MAGFRSFIQGGFECATHKNIHKTRIDVTESSRHCEFVSQDYARLREVGIKTIREGARWHLIEKQLGRYDFTSLERLYESAEREGVEIILDLMHFGWPDFVDVFSPDFIAQFADFACATARFLKRWGLKEHLIIPINEMSFLAWAGGDEGLINPHQRGRGGELKRQLASAAISASKVFLDELPTVRLLSAEPVIHIVGREEVAGDCLAAERHRLAMYEATDMLTGRLCPELGGMPEYIDVIGVNFYSRNQWVNHSGPLTRDDARYKPFHKILAEVWERYNKPVLVSETGTEDDERPSWFEYVSGEVTAARRLGVPVEGICLYPILNHPGWDDDRHCCNGLWDYADESGAREIYQPLARVIRRQQELRELAA